MSILARSLVVALSISAASAMTEEYGKVRLPGEAIIKHDGDYIVYDIEFNSQCYTKEEDSIREVSDDVFGFAAWLDDKALNFTGGRVEYFVDLIETMKDRQPYMAYYGIDRVEEIKNPCYQKYSTEQSVTIRVNRATDMLSVTNAMVQDFYEEIYQYLWPLNHRVEAESNAWSSAKITDVSKGIYEETLVRMKEQAYAYAAGVATKRFLAILGGHYSGKWFFHGADFTDERHVSKSYYAAEMGMAPLPPSFAPIPVVPPAVINLEQLTYFVEGEFEFGFTRDFHEIHT